MLNFTAGITPQIRITTMLVVFVINNHRTARNDMVGMEFCLLMKEVSKDF
jgi:hypothetical protein